MKTPLTGPGSNLNDGFEAIWIFFESDNRILPNDTLTILKEIFEVNGDGVVDNWATTESADIRQHPSIPLPSAVLMAVPVLGGLGWIKLRRTRRAA